MANLVFLWIVSTIFNLVWFCASGAIVKANDDNSGFMAYMFVAICPVFNIIFSVWISIKVIWRKLVALVGWMKTFSFKRMCENVRNSFKDFLKYVWIFIKH